MPREFTPEEAALGLQFFDIGAFKNKMHPTAVQRGDERGFKIKAHEKQPNLPLSLFFFNLRMPNNPKPGPLTPELVDECGRRLYQYAKGKGLLYHHVVGLPNAGEPFAIAFAAAARQDGRRVNVLAIDKEEIGGNRRLIGPVMGDFEAGDTVLVLDGLITGADTKLEGISVLEEEALVVRDVLVLIDRQQGGSEQLRKAGYNLYALFPLDRLLNLYVTTERMTADLRDEIIEYVRANPAV